MDGQRCFGIRSSKERVDLPLAVKPLAGGRYVCRDTKAHACTHIYISMHVQHTSHHLSQAAISPKSSSLCLSHPVNTEAAYTRQAAAQLPGTVCTPILIGRTQEMPPSRADLACILRLPPSASLTCSSFGCSSGRSLSPAHSSCSAPQPRVGINSFQATK